MCVCVCDCYKGPLSPFPIHNEGLCIARLAVGGRRGKEEPLSAIAMVLQAAPGDDDLPPPGPPRHTSAAQCLTTRAHETSPCAGYPAHMGQPASHVSTQAWSARMAYRRSPDSAEARRPGTEGQRTLHTQRPNCLPKPSQNESTHFHYQHGRHCSTKDRSTAMHCTRSIARSLARLLHCTARHAHRTHAPAFAPRRTLATRTRDLMQKDRTCTTKTTESVVINIPDKLSLEIGTPSARAARAPPLLRYTDCQPACTKPIQGYNE